MAAMGVVEAVAVGVVAVADAGGLVFAAKLDVVPPAATPCSCP
jgi:hypothetical protein